MYRELTTMLMKDASSYLVITLYYPFFTTLVRQDAGTGMY